MKNKNKITGNLGWILKHYRTKRGLSLGQMEEITGVSASYISRIEVGERKSPTLPILKKICKGLNIPIEVFLGINDESDGMLLPNFAELIFANDFTIKMKPVDAEVKKNIIELIEYIFSAEDEDKNKMIYEVLDKVDDLKCAL